MVCVLKFGFQLFTANIWQYDCVYVCVCDRESEILYFDLISCNCKLIYFQNYLLYSLVFVDSLGFVM